MKNILMNKEMSISLLNKRKKQTRRVLPEIFRNYSEKVIQEEEKNIILKYSKFQIGETIWVREPASVIQHTKDFSEIEFGYNADRRRIWLKAPERFLPSLKIPSWIKNLQGVPNGCIKEMARIFLTITDIRIEKLQDITYQDIFNEGFNGKISDYFLEDKYNKKASYKCFTDNEQDVLDWWIRLWNKTASNGYKWEDNPYIFVYSFDIEIKNVQSLRNERLNVQYKTSKDYERLYELLQTQRVVCFVDHEINKTLKIKDVCITPVELTGTSINIGARGISYVSAFDFKDMSMKEDFVKQCKKNNLEFLDPDDF